MNDAEKHIELHIARWSDRFFAWLIDFVIVIVVVEAILHAIMFPFWFETSPAHWYRNLEPLHFLFRSTAFFAYWTFFESCRGQSIGKMVLNLKTVDITGKDAETSSIAIASFGKAFLLPIDLILGWIFTNEKRQRIFNRASNTIVIKLESKNASGNVQYSKE